MAGLLVYLKLSCALQAPRTVQPEEEEVIWGADVSFQREDGKLFLSPKCRSLPRVNASAHLRMFWKDLGGHLLRSSSGQVGWLDLSQISD